MKTCSKCGLEKDLSLFYRNKNSPGGRRPDCKECSKKQKADYKEQYPVKYRCSIMGQGIIRRTVTDINRKSNNCYKENNVVSKIGNTGEEIADYLYDNYYNQIENFLIDEKLPSVDRIDSTGDYEPGNIQIVEFTENYLDGVKQAVKKTSKQIRVTYKNGEEVVYKSISEASRQLNIKRDTIIRNRDNETADRKGRRFTPVSN